MKLKKKFPNHAKYITTGKFNKLTAESFSARLKHANFDNKLALIKKLPEIN